MTKTIVVTQPYFLPNLGYFQLMNLADLFIVYDDVNFIKGGWVNRNRISTLDDETIFTVPLKEVSQNKLIKDTLIHENYTHWKTKFLNTLKHSYTKQPFFGPTYALIESIVNSANPDNSIRDLCLRSFQYLKMHLGIATPLKLSSINYDNHHLKGQDRILDICKQEKATTYVNLIGGQKLYDKTKFEQHNLKLAFHKTTQNNPLSIVDVLMKHSIVEIQELLEQYELL